MKQAVREAYAEVDTILEIMDKKYVNEIPEKIRNMFKQYKDINYKKQIVSTKSLEEQNLKRETITILAILDYNYWCKDLNRKKELIEIYTENTKIHEAELKEKYNPDNIFKNVKATESTEISEKVDFENQTTTALVEYKEEKWYRKILNWISKLLKK